MSNCLIHFESNYRGLPCFPRLAQFVSIMSRASFFFFSPCHLLLSLFCRSFTTCRASLPASDTVAQKCFNSNLKSHSIMRLPRLCHNFRKTITQTILINTPHTPPVVLWIKENSIKTSTSMEIHLKSASQPSTTHCANLILFPLPLFSLLPQTKSGILIQLKASWFPLHELFFPSTDILHKIWKANNFSGRESLRA